MFCGLLTCVKTEPGSALLPLATEYEVSSTLASIWLCSALAEDGSHSTIQEKESSDQRWEAKLNQVSHPLPQLLGRHELTQLFRPAAGCPAADATLEDDTSYRVFITCFLLWFSKFFVVYQAVLFSVSILVLRIKSRAWPVLSILSTTKLNTPPHQAQHSTPSDWTLHPIRLFPTWLVYIQKV